MAKDSCPGTLGLCQQGALVNCQLATSYYVFYASLRRQPGIARGMYSF